MQLKHTKFNWVDIGISNWPQHVTSHFNGPPISAFGIESQGDGASIAHARTRAFVRVLHVLCRVADEWDQAQSVGNEFVHERRGIAFHVHEVNGNGGDLGNHHAANGVGNSKIRVVQDHVNDVILVVDGPDRDLVGQGSGGS